MKKLKKIPEPWVFSIEKIETIKRFLYTHIPPNLKELTYPSTSAAETKKNRRFRHKKIADWKAKPSSRNRNVNRPQFSRTPYLKHVKIFRESLGTKETVQMMSVVILHLWLVL